MSKVQHDTVQSIAQIARRRYLWGIVLLVVALVGTWGLRVWRVSQVHATIQVQQDRVVSDALLLIDREFSELQQVLVSRAKALAESPLVVQALHERSQGKHEPSADKLTRYFSTLALPQRWAAELYDADFELVAWNGFQLNRTERVTPYLESLQTVVVSDEDWRQALVIWVPVQDGVHVLGVVRMAQLLYAHTPVENQYLKEYSIAERWYQQTGLPITLEFDNPEPDVVTSQGQSRLLQGIDGTLLGRVVVEPPAPDDLIRVTQRRFDDVMAFWAMLLLFWLIAGLWEWYRRAALAEPRNLTHCSIRFGVVALAWFGVRYALLILDVPARWQPGKAPLSPLFDPRHFASVLGSGLMQSTGDFLVTAIMVLLFALAFLDFAHRLHRQRGEETTPGEKQKGRLGLGLFTTLGLGVGIIVVLSLVVRHAVLDSTLDYFAREGLLPTSLVLVVFCALLIVTLAAGMLVIGIAWMAMPVDSRHRPLTWWVLGVGIVLAVMMPIAVYQDVLEAQQLTPWSITLSVLLTGIGMMTASWRQHAHKLDLLTLRNVLPVVFGVSLLLYPMFYSGLDAQRRIRMIDAADSFGEGTDPQVVFAMEQVLSAALNDQGLADISALSTFSQAHLDSLAMRLLRNSLLSSVGPYDPSLIFLSAKGIPAGRYDGGEQNTSRAGLDEGDTDQFSILRQMYADRAEPGIMVQQMTGPQPDRFRYEGVVPIGDALQPAGWIMARAEPHILKPEGETPFTRVLLPTGYGELDTDLSLARFRDGVLVRSSGRDFGRYRLDDAVKQALLSRQEDWILETVKDRQYWTYYRREAARPNTTPTMLPAERSVVAVRIKVIKTFDHLYYLLRLTVAGLIVGLPFYLLGLYLRWNAGLLPSPRSRFRDKVLNAFLVVGIIAILAVGFIGVEVVTEENERAIQHWLRQHLDRVEETLLLESQRQEMSYRVLERMPIDSLAARVGFDLNLFEGGQLTAGSRPQLVQERLIDERLPIEAYRALFFEGYQYAFVEEQLGTFTYTAGYRALLDETGEPRYVVSVPTSPQQERIEEERARTVAYLFGALLMLVVVVMITASLMANALARPIARLRVGLQDVARGHYERKLPVDTDDEIGELVETFNEMQEQLAESRRKLTQQERQLAWREMARQVAHEIKNPLTPMKLSVQHLRRAYGDVAENGEVTKDKAQRGKFASLFERITGTLIEQIDSLARIANDFSTFARMPTRILERLDLNVVVQEAVDLMQEEADVDIQMDLDPEPLVLEADREELRRIYINLLKNAIQALPNGEGQVSVSTAREEGASRWAYSTISDTGIGIPLDLHDKIFEPNFSTKTSGTGLGLAIVRKGIDALKGEIGFDTEEGLGTSFWIRLPLVEA